MSRRPASALILTVLLTSAGCGANDTPAPETVYNSIATTKESTAPAPLEKYIITCAELIYKTLNDSGDTLPKTMEVTDETMISEVLGYDMSLAEDSSVYMQLISSDLFEFTVIRASDENADAVKEMLEARQTYLREQAAYYPAQVAAADASVVGQLNGYHYLICCENAEDLQKRLMYYILLN